MNTIWNIKMAGDMIMFEQGYLAYSGWIRNKFHLNW